MRYSCQYAIKVDEDIDFLFQSILFYIPRWLWKNWEAGKIHALMMDLDIGVVQVAFLFTFMC